MRKSEINATIKSACDDAIEFMEAFAANEFSMRGLSHTLIKPMKNETVIDKLNITDDEVKQMRTIITGEEQYNRKVQKRRKEGMKERQDYLVEQQERTEDKLWQLQQAIERHPGKKQKEYAKMLGVTPMRISQLMKKLKK
jgi:DNA-directed RNA polymerase specialized sigma subunit